MFVPQSVKMARDFFSPTFSWAGNLLMKILSRGGHMFTWFSYDYNVKLSEAQNDLVIYKQLLKGDVHIKRVYPINVQVCCVGTQNFEASFLGSQTGPLFS